MGEKSIRFIFPESRIRKIRRRGRHPGRSDPLTVSRRTVADRAILAKYRFSVFSVSVAVLR